MTGIEYFLNKNKSEINKSSIYTEIEENKRQNFKRLTKLEQLKTLFIYIKNKSQGGLYKKEGNRTIGEFFGVGKDLIGRLIKELENSKHIVKLTDLDKFYKILKEEF